MTNAIAKKQPGNAVAGFGNVVDNFFQNSFRRFFDDNFWDADMPLTTGRVPVNVRETGQQYEMDVIAPGCRREDFSISVRDNLLTISFNHKEDEHSKNEQVGWVRNEYMQRSFTRTFTLDETVDVNKITAVYTDGILRLTLPKSEQVKTLSRSIEIK